MTSMLLSNKKLIVVGLLLFFAGNAFPAQLLETDAFIDVDINTVTGSLGAYTTTGAQSVWAMVIISDMNTAAAANISLKLGQGPTVQGGNWKLTAQPKNPDTSSTFEWMLGPVYLQTATTWRVSAYSSNVNDVNVHGTVYWLDLTRVSVDMWGTTDVSTKISTNGYPKVSIRDFNDTSIATKINANGIPLVALRDVNDTDYRAKLQGGYLQVDTYTVGGATPASTITIRQEMDANSTKLAGIDANLTLALADTNDIQEDWSATLTNIADIETDTAAIDTSSELRILLTGYNIALACEPNLAAVLVDTGTTLDDFLDTEVAAILADTNDIQEDWAAMIVNIADIETDTAAMATTVNAEVSDVMKTDTVAEMSQGAPPANPTFQEILNYLYRDFRNKGETTSSTHKIYNDAGAQVLYQRNLSDDGTTFTKSEQETGS